MEAIAKLVKRRECQFFMVTVECTMTTSSPHLEWFTMPYVR